MATRRSRRTSSRSDRPERKSRAGRSSERATKTKPQDDDELPELEPVDDDLPTLEAVDDDELPTLEAADDDLEELPELEPSEDSDAAIELATIDDASFDVRLTITLAEHLAKSDVPAAVEPSLRAFVQSRAGEVRWQRVVLEFAGDTLVPSVAKDLIAELVGPAKPRLVTVRRGYGDEVVFESEPPSLTLSPESRDDGMHIALPDGMDAGDLASLLGGALDAHASMLQGKALRFTEVPIHSDAVVASLGDAATRFEAPSLVAVAPSGEERVLVDRELERTASLTEADGAATLVIRGAPTDDVLSRAVAFAFDHSNTRLAGQDVTIDTREAMGVDEDMLKSVLRQMTAQAPNTVRWLRPGASGRGELVWPPMLRISADPQGTRISVEPGDRSPEAVRSAFEAECADNDRELRDRIITVDWPDSDLADALASSALGVLERAGVRRVTFSVSGADRTPMWPAPLVLRAGSDPNRLHGELDTDAGKPPEIVRALASILSRGDVESAKGKAVEITTLGSGAISRSMRTTLVEGFEMIGVTGLALREGSDHTVLLPRLFALTEGDGAAATLHARIAGREVSRVRRDAASGLSDLGLGGRAVTLQVEQVDDATRTEMTDMLVSAIAKLAPTTISVAQPSGEAVHVWPSAVDVDRGEGTLAVRVSDTALRTEDGGSSPLDSWMQDDMANALGAGLPGLAVTVHWPEAVEGRFEVEDERLERLTGSLLALGPFSLQVQGAGSDEPVHLHPFAPGPVVRLIGKRDASKPPMRMLGVTYLADHPVGALTVERDLRAMADELAGKHVLVVFEDSGQEVERGMDDPSAKAVLSALGKVAGALWLYLAPNATRPPAFLCVASRKPKAIQPGMLVADPRPKPATADRDGEDEGVEDLTEGGGDEALAAGIAAAGVAAAGVAAAGVADGVTDVELDVLESEGLDELGDEVLDPDAEPRDAGGAGIDDPSTGGGDIGGGADAGGGDTSSTGDF